jgi:hypothetical protein
MTEYEQEPLCCSFCGKNQHEIDRLIAGPGVYICNECVEVCGQLLTRAPDDLRIVGRPSGSQEPVNWDLHRRLTRVALDALASGLLPGDGLEAGVRALDLWSSEFFGAVLFWLDRDHPLSAHGHATLYVAQARRGDNHGWRSTGGASYGTFEPQKILEGLPTGLHKLGGAAQDPIRLTIGIATPDVVTIRLRSDRHTCDRHPGADGFFVLGIANDDPVTYAHSVSSSGVELSSEPVLL